MIAPGVAGAVAVMVKAAVPPVAKPGVNVTEQVNNAPAVEGKAPQSTDCTPDPGVTAVRITPLGNWSLRVTPVLEVTVPELPMVNVYVIAPLANTGLVADLSKVKLGGDWTVIFTVAGSETTPLLSVTVNIQLVDPTLFGLKVSKLLAQAKGN